MPKCTTVNQYCKAPANGPGTTGKVGCYVCGQPVCTGPGCSTRSDYMHYGKQRLCEHCLTERHGEDPSITKAMFKLYEDWAYASGYNGEANATHVRNFMEPHRKSLALKLARKASRAEGVLQKGDKLYGTCGGLFYGGTRGDQCVKTVVGLGRDWVVVRGHQSTPQYWTGSPLDLVPFRLPRLDRQEKVIMTSLGAIQVALILDMGGRDGFWRGVDEDGDSFEFTAASW